MKNLCFKVLLVIAFLAITFVGLPMRSQYMSTQQPDPALIAGRNVNMVAGAGCVDGDPYLQRQNEPSMAVSTRNPLHLLAGANDYRLVDFAASEGPLPGIPEGAAAADAWLGVYWSLNGGESWKNTLLPGHFYDTSDAGTSSPLYGFAAASDPTVRAGSNGLYYYSGIVFDRVVHGRSAIFVARFIDNNFTRIGDVDPIKYLDTSIIDEGTSGQFADKPWIAVDAPRPGAGTVPIHVPETAIHTVANTADQDVARHNVYMAYSIFLGSLSGGDRSKIMFARSTDCGTTWQMPIKVSEGNSINQGTTLAISPEDGTIYLAWRRFATPSQTSAIMICRSNDFGATFTKAVEVANVNAFDQYSAANAFRTYAFPSLAVDKNGVVYVAWSEGGVGPGGDARIVISTSTDGINWGIPQAVDNHPGRGHQIMPSLACAAGRLRATWYDTRRSEGGHETDISDPGPTTKRHTIDVWVAQALTSEYPDFEWSFKKVSKYLHWMERDVIGNPILVQKEANHPNYPLFDGGYIPFIGDYVDIASAPTFVYDVDLETQTGYWRFNTEDTDPSTSFVTWTDNRDVKPGDRNFPNYTPPSVCSAPETTSCIPGMTGKRNQNIYSSHITEGLMIGAPVNTKPLFVPIPEDPDNPQKRTFLVFLRNLTEYAKQAQLTIQAPAGLEASFWDEWPVTEEDWQCPFNPCGEDQIGVTIAPYSTVTLTVFVKPYETNPYATFRVKVEEMDGPGSFVGYIVLNPDPENTRIVPATEEYHTPDYLVEIPVYVDFDDPTVLSESLVYEPNLDYVLENVNPDIVTPTRRSPTRSSNVVNQTTRSSSLGDVSGGKVTDLRWRITNNNDATSAYSFMTIGYAPTLPEGGAYQLLIYRVSTTPGALPDDCSPFEEEHHELLLKVDYPEIASPTRRSPTRRSPTRRSPTRRSNTFSLAPGEEAVCILRLVEPSSAATGMVLSSETLGDVHTTAFDPEDYAKTVAGAAVAQAPNPDGQIHFSSSLYIIETVLPAAMANDPYSFQLEAFGGEPVDKDDQGTPDPGDDIWTYGGHWTPISLYYPSSGAPSGLSINADGEISGTPIYYPDLTYPQVISFIAEVTDISNPPQVARREFSITVDCVFHPIVVNAEAGGMICPLDQDCITEGTVYVPHGGSQTFTIVPDSCYDIANVAVTQDGTLVFSGITDSYTFENVRSDDNEIQASFLLIQYTVTGTADPAEGGTVNPAQAVVACGGSITLSISPNDGYFVADVIDNGESKGPSATYTIDPVLSGHDVVAKFMPLEGWVRRYNNSPVDGDDEASALAVHGPSGNVFVAGYSTGKTSGADYYVIRYDGEGTKAWDARYDGPAHLGDYATAVAVDSAGNAYVAGYVYRGNVAKHADYTTLKYDNSSKHVWLAAYDDRRNGMDEISAMAVDNSGFVYVTGRSEDSSAKDAPLHFDYYTIKYNANTGSVVWEARYDGAQIPNGADEATGLAVDTAGNVYVTGRSQGSGTGFDYVTVKYDSGGNQQWVRRYDGGSGDDEAAGIAVDAAGNVYVTGRSQGSGTGFDYVTVKYDSGGNQKWLHRYDGGSGDDEAAGIAVDAAGNAYVTGRSQGSGLDFDYVTIKNDPDGALLWTQRYDNVNQTDEATAIALDSAGNVYVTGRSQGNATGFDYLTLKYDGSGGFIWRARYDNKAVNGDDEATAIALDAAGNVYVTGRSRGGATGLDYATVKYEQ